eukprot:2549492-Prymnesium_polylepis.1
MHSIQTISDQTVVMCCVVVRLRTVGCARSVAYLPCWPRLDSVSSQGDPERSADRSASGRAVSQQQTTVEATNCLRGVCHRHS